MNQQKIGIVGAGIVGLAHAWSAAQRGYAVTVFERSSRASGASIRNFGMVWPIGQPPGHLRSLALDSRERWLSLARDSGIWVNPCGSIHLAHRADEWTVLQEFEAASHREADRYSCQLLSAEEVLRRSAAASPDGLLGGLLSTDELCVNPSQAVRSLPTWLSERWNVGFRFETHIARVDADGPAECPVRMTTADGQTLSFHKVVVCSGADIQTLFPAVLKESGLVRCKLQMLSVAAPGNEWKLGPHLASGLTLRHYQNFATCPGMTALRQRIADETPELDHFGIHVMASQNDAGEIILGDSHEYGDRIEPFDQSEIENLMLRELRRILRLPDWSLSRRWHGVYAKHPRLPVFETSPLPGVHLCTGTGGSGMTMSFGLAEDMWNRWTQSLP